MAEGLLKRILDDVEAPSAHNVWQKLAKVSDDALSDFLSREHPQTVTIVVSKFSPEHAARILNRLEPDLARDVVIGLSRAASLDPTVVAAIGDTLRHDLLATHANQDMKRAPADWIGAIMNYTNSLTRDHILSQIDTSQPEFANEIRRKMFTAQDIPDRVPKRAVAVVVRTLDQETLLKFLFFTREKSSEISEFFLTNISSRMADQLREELGQITSVSRKDGERVQTETIRVIRNLVTRGEFELVEEEED